MAIPIYDLTIDQGVDFSVDITFYDEDNAAIPLSAGQAAISPTSSTYQALVSKIKATPEASAVEKTFTITPSSSVKGKATFILADTDTTGLSEGKHYFDVIGTKTAVTGGAQTDKEKLLKGRVQVSVSVSD